MSVKSSGHSAKGQSRDSNTDPFLLEGAPRLNELSGQEKDHEIDF